MPIWPFRRSRADTDAQLLVESVIQASRRPIFYGEGRAPDTLEGRVELITLHAALALFRLKADPGAAPLAQSFTDLLFRHFDAGLREAGVGDLAVPKRMRALAGGFYGRVAAYDGALAVKDGAALRAAVGRNVLGDEAADYAETLASYAAAAAARQGAAPISALADESAWTLA